MAEGKGGQTAFEGDLFKGSAPGAHTSARRKDRGRPHLPDEERRTVSVHVRLSPTEHARLSKKLRKAALPLGTYLRHVALGSDPVRIEIPPINHDTRAELADIGRNLNQIARAMNTEALAGQMASVPGILADELARLRQQVEAVALTLASGIPHGA